MSNEVARASPTLPGLLPDAESRLLIDDVATFWPDDGSPAQLVRALAPAERSLLERRNQDLATALRPVSMSSEAKKRAAQAIAEMFIGFPAMRNADAPGLTSAYLLFLQDLPLFAVQAACVDAAQGRIEGNDPNWAPTSARLHEVARGKLVKLDEEKIRVEKCLKGTVAAVVDDSQRARVKDGLGDLAKEMARRVAQEDAEFEERRREVGERQRAGTERKIMEEYRRLGVSPMRWGDGLLASPSLVAQLGLRAGSSTKAKERTDDSHADFEG